MRVLNRGAELVLEEREKKEAFEIAYRIGNNMSQRQIHSD